MVTHLGRRAHDSICVCTDGMELDSVHRVAYLLAPRDPGVDFTRVPSNRPALRMVVRVFGPGSGIPNRLGVESFRSVRYQQFQLANQA